MSGTGGPSVVLVSIAVASVAGVAVLSGPREAGYVLAAVLAAVAVARALLPLRVVGPFAVRSRAIDVGVCGALALSLAVVSYALPAG